MATEFKLLQLQEQVEAAKQPPKQTCSEQQQTTPPESPRPPTTILESDDQAELETERHQVLQHQLTDQVESLLERIQTLGVELSRTKTSEASLKEQLVVEAQTVRALQSELKNCLEQVSAYEFHQEELTGKLRQAKADLDGLSKAKEQQEKEFADVMECFVKEKTSFVEARKKQVEQQFLEMERSYRTLFEESIELKKQLSEAKSAVEAIRKQSKEKECQFNLEVSAYEKRLYAQSLKSCSC